MSKYIIDADRLKAEIERLKIKACCSQAKEEEITAALSSLDLVIRFIDSLQQEQPELDLEEEIFRTYRDGSVADTSDMDHVSYENIAHHFYSLGINARKEERK